MTSRPPHAGHRRLIIAIDIGTTFSGVSYSLLEPGQVPGIEGVTRFPAQERVGGDSKIPSILYYDKQGNVRAIGAEATKEGIEQLVEEQGWMRAEWFKLHLRPSHMILSENIPILPGDKSAVDVFADFFKYLYRCSLTYISETHSNGDNLLRSINGYTEFVITHPNGWEGLQQSHLRKAAVRGGLVTDFHDPSIHFVTEGEAALHFCIRNHLTTEALKKDGGVIVVDAGGGTVDLSAYSHFTTAHGKCSFEEITVPKCLFKGSIFVTRNAHHYLQKKLHNSSFSDDITHILRCFDQTTKLSFRDIQEPQYIKFGRIRDQDDNLGIRSGQLRISGRDLASFFEPCIRDIIKAIKDQSEDATELIHSIFLVGGFAASDWLFSQLKIAFEPLGIDVCRPDTHLNKIVADGAVSYYLDHFVTVRVARHTYGTPCYMLYDSTNPEHLLRSSSVFVDADGEKYLPNLFSPILIRGTQVKEVTEFRESFFRKAETLDSLQNPMLDSIIRYRGHSEPRWTDVESDMFTVLCTVYSDISRIRETLRPKRNNDGKQYYELQYDIVLLFGLTELKVQVCWRYKGKEQRSPAKVVYQNDPFNELDTIRI